MEFTPLTRFGLRVYRQYAALGLPVDIRQCCSFLSPATQALYFIQAQDYWTRPTPDFIRLKIPRHERT